MPNLNQGDKLLFTVWYKLAEQQLMNTQMLSYNTDIGGPDDYQVFASSYCNEAVSLGGLVDLLSSQCTNQVTWQKVSMQMVYPQRYAAQEAGTGPLTPISGPTAPVNSALVVQKRSLIAKRYGVGSWHQAGLPASKLTTSGGDWDGGLMVSIQTALSSWFDPAHIPPGMMGNVDPILWNIKQPTRTTFITSWVAKPTVRTMHRRTKFLGI